MSAPVASIPQPRESEIVVPPGPFERSQPGPMLKIEFSLKQAEAPKCNEFKLSDLSIAGSFTVALGGLFCGVVLCLATRRFVSLAIAGTVATHWRAQLISLSIALSPGLLITSLGTTLIFADVVRALAQRNKEVDSLKDPLIK